MAESIIPRPRVIKGQLFHQVGEVAFTNARHAVSAWSVAQADAETREPDLRNNVDRLKIERAELAATARHEAASAARWQRIAGELAAEISRLRKQLKRAGGAS